MKYSVIGDGNGTAGMYIDPNVDNYIKKEIILWRDPVLRDEALTLRYMTAKITDLDGSKIAGVLKHEKVLFKGAVLQEGDTLTVVDKKHKKTSGPIVTVGADGLVTDFPRIKPSQLDVSFTIPWNKVSNTPTTVEGYKISNLAIKDKINHLGSKSPVMDYAPARDTRGPINVNKFIEVTTKYKDHRVVGSVILRHTKDGSYDIPKGATIANGGIHNSGDYPILAKTLGVRGVDRGNVKFAVPDLDLKIKELLVQHGVVLNAYVMRDPIS